MIFLLIGAYNYSLNTNIDFLKSSSFSDKYVTIKGRISDLPSTYDDKQYYYVVKSKELVYNGESHTVNDTIRVSSQNKYKYGDCIEVSGFLSEFSDKLNSSSFDTKLYYKSKGIFFNLVEKETKYSDEQYSQISIYNAVNTVRYNVSFLIDKYYQDDSSAFLKAILIGDKSNFTDDYNAILDKSGAKRFLYTPFLHILLINSIIGFALTFIPLTRTKRDYIFILVLLAYAIFNSSRPFFIKTSLVLIFLILYRRRYGFVYFPNILATVIFLIAFFNPLYIYDVGFILSVACNIIIYVFKDDVYKMLKFIKNYYLRNAVALWLICTIGLLPISSYYFNGTATYTILSVLFFMPFVTMVLCVSPFLFVLLKINGTGFIFEKIMAFLLWTLSQIPILIDKLPFSYINSGAFSLKEILCFYLILIIIKCGFKKKLKLFSVQLLMISASTLLAIIITGKILGFGSIEMTFVNVGQGDGAIIKLPYKHSILIDGGGSADYSDYNIGKYVYVPYLKHDGIFNVEMAMVSHYHKDHCEGIIEAINELNVKALIMPDCQPDNKYRIMLEAAAKKRGTKIYYANTNTKITTNSKVEINILSPDTDALKSDDLNDTSIVAEIIYGDFKALFTGDITQNIETKLVNSELLKQYDVVKVPHHGSVGSNSKSFIDTLKAKYGIIDVGENNVYNFPSPIVEQLYKDANTQIIRTDHSGDIKIRADKNGIKEVKTYKGVD